MTDTPLISICIANYNGAEIISACIESVLAQDGNFPVEILVHDDASTDNSADRVACDYPSVRLIRSENNVGFCIANNRMVAAAQGEFILLLNNDAELFPDALRMLLGEARSQGKPAILSLPQYDHNTGEVIDRGCLLDPFFNPVPNHDPNREDVAMVIGACLWIPKKLWLELDGFPEWFGSIAEDMYLCCRARLAGFSVIVPDVSGYRHHVGQSFGGGKAIQGRLSSTFHRRALSERNKTFVMIVCQPVLPMFFTLPLHLLSLFVEGGMLALSKWSIRPWGEIYAPLMPCLWRTRHTLIMLRRDIQPSRRISLHAWFETFVWLPRKLVMLIRYGMPHMR